VPESEWIVWIVRIGTCERDGGGIAKKTGTHVYFVSLLQWGRVCVTTNYADQVFNVPAQRPILQWRDAVLAMLALMGSEEQGVEELARRVLALRLIVFAASANFLGVVALFTVVHDAGSNDSAVVVGPICVC